MNSQPNALQTAVGDAGRQWSSRREFCVLGGCAIFSLFGPRLVEAEGQGAAGQKVDVVAIDRNRILRAADRYLHEKPITITAYPSDRSAGGKHDYFSEGDYWWPDPKNPNGPYIQRDGMSNLDNFVAHRHALIRLSVQVPALVGAWLLTRKNEYFDHATEHLRAWFVHPETRMNPNLQYSQAIHGRSTGRGIGVIDTIHLVEVTRAISIMERDHCLAENDKAVLQKWFTDYLEWVTTSEHGKEEREAKNNHGTCWVMQVAAFASYTRNADLAAYCSERFKTILVPNQIAADGSFPLELRRTKPYNYSIFNLDAMATICQILSTHEEDLWSFTRKDGSGVRKAMKFMFPYLADKLSWPYARDVQYFDDFPVRQPSLLFAGIAYGEPAYLDLWGKLNPDPVVEEVMRNYPIRQPILWV